MTGPELRVGLPLFPRQGPRGVGADPYPLGLRAMGKNIERAIQGSMEKGLLTKSLALEDIYYRTTLNT